MDSVLNECYFRENLCGDDFCNQQLEHLSTICEPLTTLVWYWYGDTSEFLSWLIFLVFLCYLFETSGLWNISSIEIPRFLILK